eukprot:3397131-Amphidinium_carterae.1
MRCSLSTILFHPLPPFFNLLSISKSWLRKGGGHPSSPSQLWRYLGRASLATLAFAGSESLVTLAFAPPVQGRSSQRRAILNLSNITLSNVALIDLLHMVGCLLVSTRSTGLHTKAKSMSLLQWTCSSVSRALQCL